MNESLATLEILEFETATEIERCDHQIEDLRKDIEDQNAKIATITSRIQQLTENRKSMRDAFVSSLARFRELQEAMGRAKKNLRLQKDAILIKERTLNDCLGQRVRLERFFEDILRRQSQFGRVIPFPVRPEATSEPTGDRPEDSE